MSSITKLLLGATAGAAILASLLQRVPSVSKTVFVVRAQGWIEITTETFLKAERGVRP